MTEPLIQISNLTHAYGQRVALDSLSLAISANEIFGFLGPNGSGKTTLFRILSTLVKAAPGTVKMAGLDLSSDAEKVRRLIGVVFQSPSIDKQLTARENLVHHGHLYGLRGAELARRAGELLDRVKLLDRADEYTSNFSGGMRRRVELAKSLLHRPKILLLDEPSTGLDPAARIDLWQLLSDIQKQDNVTILLTTHLMEEADKCTRLAVLNHGKLIACDTPDALKGRVGGDVITIDSRNPQELMALIKSRFGVDPGLIDAKVRLERPAAHQFVPELIESAPGLVQSISIGKPTLEDVFIDLTGHRLS